MKIVKGDLLDLFDKGQFDAIVHGCNCFNNMGAGIAAQIKRRYPEAYQADCLTISGDRNKLGSYSKGICSKGTIINAYTQYYPGFNPLDENYLAIDKVMRKIAVEYEGQPIGLPLIGAGLAGGDWNVIKDIIANNLEGMVDYTIVEWSR